MQVKILVGVVVSEKKTAELTKRGLFLPHSGTVEYVPIRAVDECNTAQPNFWLIKPYKAMDDALRKWVNDPSIADVACAGNLAAQSILSDRWMTYNSLGPNFFPPTILLDSTSSSTEGVQLLERFVSDHGRCIVKPQSACGTEWSHIFGIYDSPHSIRKFVNSHSGTVSSFIVQKVIPHDGTFLKVFVIGKETRVFRRNSIRDTQVNTEFNTQGMFSTSTDHREGVVDCIEADVLRIVKEIQSRLQGVGLLGIDLVRSTEVGGELLVVDVNYFPSYKELDNQEFLTMMDSFVEGRMRQLCERKL